MFCWICKPNTPKKETKEEEESSTMILTLICVKPDILINNHHKQSIASTTNLNQKLSQITGPTKQSSNQIWYIHIPTIKQLDFHFQTDLCTHPGLLSVLRWCIPTSLYKQQHFHGCPHWQQGRIQPAGALWISDMIETLKGKDEQESPEKRF